MHHRAGPHRGSVGRLQRKHRAFPIDAQHVGLIGWALLRRPINRLIGRGWRQRRYVCC